MEQLLAVGFGHADQIGDGQQRQAHRDVVDEVSGSFSAAARTISRAATASFSSSAATAPRSEKPRHDLAQPGVLGCVVVDQQRLGQVELLSRGAVGHPHHRALAVGRPQVAVPRDRLDVLVAADHPVAAVVEDRLVLLVPPHRRGLAQLGELGDRDALQQDVGVGEVVAGSERTCALRHISTIHCEVKCMAAKILCLTSPPGFALIPASASAPAPGRPPSPGARRARSRRRN